MRDNDVTLGEVYRRLVDIDERHGAQLTAIEAQARITNGRTSKLEVTAGRLDARVETVEREIGEIKRRPTTAKDESGDIRIPVNARTLTAILMTLAALVVAYLTARAGG